jgi:hypothetical protein
MNPEPEEWFFFGGEVETISKVLTDNDICFLPIRPGRETKLVIGRVFWS